jgi:hypothetical protein
LNKWRARSSLRQLIAPPLLHRLWHIGGTGEKLNTATRECLGILLGRKPRPARIFGSLYYRGFTVGVADLLYRSVVPYGLDNRVHRILALFGGLFYGSKALLDPIVVATLF